MNVTEIITAVDFLKKRGFLNPEAGIVLGTGLSALASEIDVIEEISYQEIPGFVSSTVESHAGKLLFGMLSGKKVIAMQGRFHFYEGFTMQQITFPVRVMKELGINYLLLSNACGGINLAFEKGNLMLISDHINLLPSNPLIGKNEDAWGPRFPDMGRPYDVKLSDLFEKTAAEAGIRLHKGVYAAVAGPNLETRAEYRFLKRAGADVVGMSTVPEVIVANHMQLPCAAVSVITDSCDPDNLHPVSLAEIIETARAAEKNLSRLFREVIGKL